MNSLLRIVSKIPVSDKDVRENIIKRQSVNEERNTNYFLSFFRKLSDHRATMAGDHDIRCDVIACHSIKPFVAFSIGSFIAVFDFKLRQWIEPNIHHDLIYYDGISCMEWCEYSDQLAIGTNNGIVLMKFDSLEVGNVHQSSVKQLKYWSYGIHELSKDPNGRYLASISRNDRKIIIWDMIMHISTPLYCLEGTVADTMAWSKSGYHFAVNNK
jgi:WD40 repeat protein